MRIKKKKTGEIKEVITPAQDSNAPEVLSDAEVAEAIAQGQRDADAEMAIEDGTASEVSAQDSNAEPEAVAPVYVASIKAPSDIETREDKAELLKAARTSARVTYGVSSEPQRDESGEIRKDTRGRAIPHYTPRRPADVVAADELSRFDRLPWAQSARQRCSELACSKGASLTDAEIEKVLALSARPMSYDSKHASKPLYGRVMSYMREHSERARNATN